jgi:hypothetical protein
VSKPCKHTSNQDMMDSFISLIAQETNCRAGKSSPCKAVSQALILDCRGGGQDFQIHSCKYSNKTSIGKAPLILATQLLFCKAWTIIRCFKALLGMTLIRLGACTAIVLPKSQRSSQNLVQVPLPFTNCVLYSNTMECLGNTWDLLR